MSPRLGAVHASHSTKEHENKGRHCECGGVLGSLFAVGSSISSSPDDGHWASGRKGVRSPLPMMPEQSKDDRHDHPSPPEKRPWQFSLRSLFVLTTFVAVLLSLAVTSPSSVVLCLVLFVFIAIILGLAVAEFALLEGLLRLLLWTSSVVKRRVVPCIVQHLRSCEGDAAKEAQALGDAVPHPAGLDDPSPASTEAESHVAKG